MIRAFQIIGAIAGVAVGKALGFSVLIPLSGYAAFLYLTPKLGESLRLDTYRLQAVSILGGHTIWFVAAGLILPAVIPQVALDVIVMTAGIVSIFMWRKSITPLAVLAALQALAIVANFAVMNSSNSTPLLTHILFRAGFIAACIMVFVKSTKADKTEVRTAHLGVSAQKNEPLLKPFGDPNRRPQESFAQIKSAQEDLSRKKS